LKLIENNPPQVAKRRRPRDLALPAVEAWAEHIALPNGLTFWLPSKQMRAAAEYVVKEIFVRRRYFRPGFAIQPGDTVVDIGANMGLFALWAAPQTPQGRVLAIEPSWVLDCLVQNARINRLDNVTAVPVAVGNDGEELELVEYPGFNIVSHPKGCGPAWITRLLIFLRYFRYRCPAVRVKAPCQSLGTIIEEHGLKNIHFLKVDCEGAEYEMFRHLPPDHWRRIERIAMEFHELHPGDRHGELVSLMEQQGFRVEIRKPLVEYYFMRFGELWARRER